MAASVLIVDDEAAIRAGACRYAQMKEYRPVPAASAEEALALAERERVDVALVDLRLPGMDGLSLAQRLIAVDPECPVLLLTAYPDMDTMHRAMQLGVYEYLIKPIELPHLFASVARALEHRRLVAENRTYQESLELQVRERTEALAATNRLLQQEVNERQAAEVLLRESEERYRRIAAATTDYIFSVVIEDGRPVTTVHGAGCSVVTGYSAEEFAATPLLWIEMVPEADRNSVRQQAQRVLIGQDPGPVQHRIRRKDGSLRWVNNTPVLHRGTDGKLCSYDGLIRDVTAQMQAEARERALGYLRDRVWRMTRSDDVQDIIRAVGEAVSSAGIAVNEYAINVVDRVRRPPAIRTYHLLRNGKVQQGQLSASASRTVVRWWRAGQPVYRTELLADDPFHEVSRFHGTSRKVRSVLDLPFSHGTLAMNASAPAAFSEEEIAFLKRLADALSEGYRRLDDLGRLEERAREAEALARSVSAMASQEALAQVLATVVQQAALLVTAPQAVVYLFDPAEGLLVPRAQVGHDGEIIKLLRLRPGENDSGIVFQSGVPTTFRSGAQPSLRPQTAALYEQATGGPYVGSSAAVPLRCKGKVIGALSVGGFAEELADHQLKALTALGEQTAMAIERAEHLATVERHAAELQQQMAERYRAEQRFASIFETTPLLIAISTVEEARLLEVNPAFLSIMGYTREEVIGRTSAELGIITTEQRAEILRRFDATAKIHNLDLTVKTSSGGLRHGIFSVDRLPHDQLLISMVDVTERRQLQEQVERQHLQAVHADRLRSLGEMAAGVAHELNQPLNGIRAFAEGTLFGLQHGWALPAEELQTTLADIVVQVDRMTEIIDHMRTFSHDSSEQEPAPFALGEAVEGAMKLIGAQLRGHGIEVAVEAVPQTPACLGWSHQMEQVVLNLLNNALDALDARAAQVRAGGERLRGGWRPRVTIQVGPGLLSGEIFLAVTDNGGGIRPGTEERIFEPFFTTKGVGKGTGLGLAIARGLVKRHGGRLELKNRPEVGATFTAILPAHGAQR